MRVAWRLLLGCLMCSVASGLGVSTVALGDSSVSVEGPGGSSSFGSPLVVVGSPTEAEQLQAQEEAKLSSPEAVAEREASRTKFKGLDAAEAATVDGGAFPGPIDRVLGGTPQLPPGAKITGYASDDVAQVNFGGTIHGVVESSTPLAVEVSPGQRTALNLGLTPISGAFEPQTPVVSVRIPKQLRDGVTLGGTGVSITPVDAQGTALGGSEGMVDGASVLYANTQTDTDTAIKPTPEGVEASTILRSPESPEQLFYRIGLPAGAKLVQSTVGAGPIAVEDEGVTLARILPPAAEDAVGTPVGVAMSVANDIVTLAVDHGAGQVTYPVDVDPTVTDEEIFFDKGTRGPTNWRWNATANGKIHNRSINGGEAVEDYTEGGYKGNEFGAYLYPIREGSEARVTSVEVNSSGVDNGGNLENSTQIVSSKGVVEAEYKHSLNYGRGWFGSGANGSPGNAAQYGQWTTGSGESFAYLTYESRVQIKQEKGAEVTWDKTDPTVDGGRPNAMYGIYGTNWLGPRSLAAFEVRAKDPGLGVSYLSVSNGAYWGYAYNPFTSGECSGVQCNPELHEAYGYNSLLPDGEYSLSAAACDVAETTGGCSSYESGLGWIKVDGTPPHNIVLSGLPANDETGKSIYQIKAQATDGSGSTLSSGVKSITLSVDGKELGTSSGYCSSGPCTATGEWTLNTTEYSPGIHKIRVTATDNAENVASEEFSLTVSAATPVDVGPGAVEPSGGEFNLNSTDVSISAPGGSLTVGRNYESRHLTAGTTGPLGPQWGLSLGGQQSLLKLGNGSVTLNAGNGKQTTFVKAGKGTFTSPAGDENLVLSEGERGGETEYYLLKNTAQGTLTKFTKPTGGNGELWTPSIQEGPVSTDDTTFAFQTVTVGESKITEPTEMLAPVPAGVSCSPTLNPGCRALTFKYASSTTATGENESEWKEYAGRLMQISLTAYNPATKAMQTTPVAEYAYDKQGRLRAEWDPRVSPALKTIYGYDAEGHVSALTRPGQQSWLLHYGAIVGDLGTGRLLSVTRPGAATGLWNGEALKNTAVPTLSSTSPAIGTTLSVASNGTWSNGPLAYAYQWEDCNGSQCTAIPGATNQGYTPQASDAGYTLVAQVSATNAGGSAVASSAATSAITVSAPKYSLAFGSSGAGAGQLKEAVTDAVDGKGNIWVTDDANNRIDEFSASGAFIKAAGFGVSNGEYVYEECTSSCRAGIAGSQQGQFDDPWGIAINQASEDVYVTNQADASVEVRTTGGNFVASFGGSGTGPGEFGVVAGLAIDPNGNVWVADNSNNRIEEFTSTGTFIRAVGSTGSGNGQFSGPGGFAFVNGNMYVADFGNKRIQEFSLSGAYLGQFASVGEPYEIGGNSAAGEIYETDFAGKVDEFNQAGVLVGSFGTKGTGNGQFEKPTGLTVNAAGDIYVVDDGNSRVQEWTPTYSTNNPVPEPPALGSSAVSTIEYHVLLSGSGLPTMTAGEVANWGQQDDPAEATAFFPPDEPQGWPAKDYKRASIYYLDSSDRTVNTAGPSGAISTSEYNSTNDVVRALSPLNRAAALKEGTKSAEVSKLLDSESTYNSEGTELESTLGPEHKVKLASGAQVQARQDVHYSYDEGAPAEGGPYRLATKVTEAALTSGKEEEVRTTTTSYSGQENLGWKLRRPTSVTTDPGKLNLTHTTLYEPSTGNVIETRLPAGSRGTSLGSYVYSTQITGASSGPAPSGVAVDSSGHLWVASTEYSRVVEFSTNGEYLNQFGTEGTGNGQFKKPRGIALDSEGNIWVADTGNNRVEELSSTGTFIRAFGSEGTTTGKFKSPTALAIDSSGNVWVADTGNKRVQELSSTGTYLRSSESGLFEKPEGIAADAKGDVWVSDAVENFVFELSSAAKLTGAFGGQGTGNGQFKEPAGIAISGEDAYVVDRGNNRVQEIKLKATSGEYLRQFGTSGTGNGQFKEPQSIAVGKQGHVWVADVGNSRIQELTSTGEYLNQAHEPVPLKTPSGVAADALGHLWIADTGNSRIEEFSASTAGYMTEFGTEGTGSGQFKKPQGIAVDSEGNVWVADTGNNRVEELSSTGTVIRAFGSEGTETGKFKSPAAIAIDSSGNVWVADARNNRVQEFSSTGTYLRESASGLLEGPEGIAADQKGDVWVSNTGGSSVVELSPAAEKIGKFGTAGSENGEFKGPTGIVISGEGIYVADRFNDRVQEFRLKQEKGEYSGEYVTQFGGFGTINGKFRSPQAITLDTEGDLWVADIENNRVQKFDVKPSGAHDTQTIYYTTAANSEYAGCGGHPEWANMVCETKPAGQPETSGLPEIPVMTYSAYNIWGEPEKTVETSGSTTRTTTATYDAGGRLLTSAISSTVDTALPTVTDEYNKETGALTTQSTTVEGKTKKLTSVYNSLAQFVSYTDADENTATYSYDIDGRIEKTNDGKGTQTYTYDSITGFLTKLVDSMAGTFTASYDVQGDLLTEGYPNGMNATDTYNQLGQPTGLEYIKTTHCTSGCTWFSDTAIPSIHDQWLSQTSSLSSQSYAYDNAGRLTQVQDTPTGKGCTTRIYGYDEDTNRTSLTSREPNGKGECVSEGGTVENHTYDSADRLTDTGTAYDAFGNTTSLPAADAGGTALTSTYYVNDKLATQTQSGETIGYYLDPAGRSRETVATGKTSSDIISHYASGSGTPAWTIEPASGHTTRNIPGINGALAAVQTNTETPVLEITSLHGDVVATAALSETETKLLSTSDTTEYGVPRSGTTPPKYSWLGADALQTELPTGVIAMGARSYVPQVGRFLQTDPRPGGSADAYAYTFGDPVNSSDPSGEWTFETPGWLTQFDGEWAAGGEAREAARLAAARAEAERLARQAAEEAASTAAANAELAEWACENSWGGCGGGGELEPLGGSEGWACEYAAETGQEAAGCGGGQGMGGISDSLIGEEDNGLEHHCQVGQIYFNKKCVQSKPRVRQPPPPPNHPSGPNRSKESCWFGWCPIISGERE